MRGILLLFLVKLSLFASFSLTERENLLQSFHNSQNLTASSTITLHKGWNTLKAYKDGIDVMQTFALYKEVDVVATFDEVSKKWAIFTAQRVEDDKDILRLNYIEPNVLYGVHVTKDTHIEIKSKVINAQCVELLNDDKYEFMINSALDKKETLNAQKALGVKTRYLTNYERGLYDDTRVMLIYPKLKITSKKRVYRYGPARPKIALKFTKEYEGKFFFVYDYKFEKCYKGIFPSKRIPPFPMLKEVK